MTLKRVAYISRKVALMAAAQRILSASEVEFARAEMAGLRDDARRGFNESNCPELDNRKGRRKRAKLERKL